MFETMEPKVEMNQSDRRNEDNSGRPCEGEASTSTTGNELHQDDEDERSGSPPAHAASAEADENGSGLEYNLVQGMKPIQMSRIFQRKPNRLDEETTGGAVGGHQPSASPVIKCHFSSQTSQQPLIPTSLPKLKDPAEEVLRAKFIANVTKYEGAAIAPNENFELQWTVYQDELEKYINEGLTPLDTVASAGIDEDSYKHMQHCAEILQDHLYADNLLESLGNLKGFRRIFSKSHDQVLRHAFRGKPSEVLQNVYYGGEGTLPEDRMLLSDPFHFTKNQDPLDE